MGRKKLSRLSRARRQGARRAGQPLQLRRRSSVSYVDYAENLAHSGQVATTSAADSTLHRQSQASYGIVPDQSSGGKLSGLPPVNLNWQEMCGKGTKKSTRQQQQLDDTSGNDSDSNTNTLSNGCQSLKEEQHERRLRATERERKRQQKITAALGHLRRAVPIYPGAGRTSKIQVLHLAINYIRDLLELLSEYEQRDSASGNTKQDPLTAGQTCNTNDVDVRITDQQGVQKHIRLRSRRERHRKSHTPSACSGTLPVYPLDYVQVPQFPSPESFHSTDHDGLGARQPESERFDPDSLLLNHMFVTPVSRTGLCGTSPGDVHLSGTSAAGMGQHQAMADCGFVDSPSTQIRTANNSNNSNQANGHALRMNRNDQLMNYCLFSGANTASPSPYLAAWKDVDIEQDMAGPFQMPAAPYLQYPDSTNGAFYGPTQASFPGGTWPNLPVNTQTSHQPQLGSGHAIVGQNVMRMQEQDTIPNGAHAGHTQVPRPQQLLYHQQQQLQLRQQQQQALVQKSNQHLSSPRLQLPWQQGDHQQSNKEPRQDDRAGNCKLSTPKDKGLDDSAAKETQTTPNCQDVQAVDKPFLPDLAKSSEPVRAPSVSCTEALADDQTPRIPEDEDASTVQGEWRSGDSTPEHDTNEDSDTGSSSTSGSESDGGEESACESLDTNGSGSSEGSVRGESESECQDDETTRPHSIADGESTTSHSPLQVSAVYEADDRTADEDGSESEGSEDADDMASGLDTSGGSAVDGDYKPQSQRRMSAGEDEMDMEESPDFECLTIALDSPLSNVSSPMFCYRSSDDNLDLDIPEMNALARADVAETS